MKNYTNTITKIICYDDDDDDYDYDDYDDYDE